MGETLSVTQSFPIEHERSIFNTIRKEVNESEKGQKIRDQIEQNRLFLENDYKNSLNEYQEEFLRTNNFNQPKSLKSTAASKSKKSTKTKSRRGDGSQVAEAPGSDGETVILATERTDVAGNSFSCAREGGPGDNF